MGFSYNSLNKIGDSAVNNGNDTFIVWVIELFKDLFNNFIFFKGLTKGNELVGAVLYVVQIISYRMSCDAAQ